MRLPEPWLTTTTLLDRQDDRGRPLDKATVMIEGEDQEKRKKEKLRGTKKKEKETDG